MSIEGFAGMHMVLLAGFGVLGLLMFWEVLSTITTGDLP
jgi:hypothetical protein